MASWFCFTRSRSRDVISAALGAEDQETVETGPVIHLPGITSARVGTWFEPGIGCDCGVTRRLENLCIVDGHVASFHDASPTLRHGGFGNCGQVGERGFF